MDLLYFESPVGPLTLETSDGISISALYFGKNTDIVDTDIRVLSEAREQLEKYFSGELEYFSVPLQIEGTAFQKKVWNALLKIPYGATFSYKDIAVSIGNEKACRAVGMANNKNKLPIFIPCHRVIGKSGMLVGYAGGLDIKEYLLRLEGIH